VVTLPIIKAGAMRMNWSELKEIIWFDERLIAGDQLNEYKIIDGKVFSRNLNTPEWGETIYTFQVRDNQLRLNVGSFVVVCIPVPEGKRLFRKDHFK
jgi:hypothetical protein